MKTWLILPVLAALAACTEAPGNCPARREVRTIDRLIADTEGNIARGYATVPVRSSGIDLCLGGAQENIGVSFCTDGTTRTKAVAVDAAAEQRKLDGLRARRAALVRAMADDPACSTQG